MCRTVFEKSGGVLSEKVQLKGLRRAAFYIGISLFLYNVASYAAMYLFAWVTKEFVNTYFSRLNAYELISSTAFRWAAVLVCQDVFGVLAFWSTAHFFKPPVLQGITKKRINFKSGCAIFVLCIAIMQIGSYMSAFLSQIVESIRGVPLENELNLLVFNSSPVIVFVMSVVIAPVVEEFIYRKYITDALRAYGERFALVCSSVIFALAHGNLYQVFYTFGVGMVFGYLYLKTDNIKISIFYHMAVNFMGTIVPLLFMRTQPLGADGFSVGMIFYFMYLLLLFALTCIGIFLAFLYRGKISFSKMPYDAIDTKKKVSAFVFNIGMVLTFLTIAVSFMLSF